MGAAEAEAALTTTPASDAVGEATAEAAGIIIRSVSVPEYYS